MKDFMKYKCYLVDLAKAFENKGGKLYVVGGAVRNYLMEKQIRDIDLVSVGLDDKEVEELLVTPFVGEKVGKSFPVYIWGKYEIALARTERSTGDGHKDFEFRFGKDVTIEEDANRRDFTINALYYDIVGEEIIDPTKRGLKDLRRRRLNAVGDHFNDDPLRVFRAARFLSEYPGLVYTKDLKKRCVSVSQSKILESLSAERVALETNKAFKGKCPRRYFEFLRKTSALKSWFPETEKLYKVKDLHNGTTWNHVMAMLEHGVASDVGWSVLLHDIGKVKTDPKDYPHHYGHENENELATEILDRFNLSNEIKNVSLKCQKYHMKLHRIDELRPGTIFDMMEDLSVYESLILSNVHRLDCESSGRKNNSKLFLEMYDRYRDVCKEIRGYNVLAKHPEAKGKRVGELLRQWRINEFKKYV